MPLIFLHDGAGFHKLLLSSIIAPFYFSDLQLILRFNQLLLCMYILTQSIGENQ
uniref:Uncharacterized protein n=1 Tax=Helianthus annuus TaxID=4232 RepID=A0A251SHF1_HELAN